MSEAGLTIADLGALDFSTNAETAATLLDLAGKRVIDIGCGPGAFTRSLARQGAQVIGVDPNEGTIEKARAAAAEEGLDIAFRVGVGESLPEGDGEVDIVVLSNSLHHVPLDSMADALAEAARVLVPGGFLYVMEPVAQGAHFIVQELWNDETMVRRKAYEALQGLAALGLEAEHEIFYRSERELADFADYEAMAMSRAGQLWADFEKHRDEIERRFLAQAIQRDGAYFLTEAFRVNLYRKRG
jgi:ubiquinone/menaquinone biosynthesis C-methylase UbiE